MYRVLRYEATWHRGNEATKQRSNEPNQAQCHCVKRICIFILLFEYGAVPFPLFPAPILNVNGCYNLHCTAPCTSMSHRAVPVPVQHLNTCLKYALYALAGSPQYSYIYIHCNENVVTLQQCQTANSQTLQPFHSTPVRYATPFGAFQANVMMI